MKRGKAIEREAPRTILGTPIARLASANYLEYPKGRRHPWANHIAERPSTPDFMRISADSRENQRLSRT
jgi:hypothetical protein